MRGRHTDQRRANRRAFQPTLEGGLESRLLLSQTSGLSKPNNYPNGTPGEIHTARGGHAVEVTNATGQSYYIIASTGTIQAYRMSGGRFGLIIKGTGVDSEVSINPLDIPRLKGSAHTFDSTLSHYTQMVNIGAITVTNGTVGAILGYRTAILSGPLSVSSTNRVDRIAFDTIAPGATINVGGDLNTLDVLNNLTASGSGTGVIIGRDLNSLTVGGNLSVTNNAVFEVGRYQGLVPQPAKGTAPQPQPITANTTSTLTAVPLATASIYGNLVVNSGGQFLIGSGLQGFFIVNGATVGVGSIAINGGTNLFLAKGGIFP